MTKQQAQREMVVTFTEFSNFVQTLGYIAVDQRQDKTPASIFHIKTRNGIKVELKRQAGRDFFVVGHGIKEEKQAALASELESRNRAVEQMAKFTKVRIDGNVLSDFASLCECVEHIDQLVAVFRDKQRRRGQYDISNALVNHLTGFVEMARIAQKWGVAIDPARGFGIFDRIDGLITRGTSVKANRIDSQWREHVVPCKLIVDETFRMIKEGCTDSEIVEMVTTNLAIVIITEAEREHLDFTLGLQTCMPSGWKFGDDPFARLTAGGVKWTPFS